MASAFRTSRVNPVRHFRQRRVPVVIGQKIRNFRQSQRQIFFLKRNPAAFFAINHRNRFAPIPLAGENPVTQLEVYFCTAKTVGFGILNRRFHGFFLIHPVKKRRINMRPILFKSLFADVAAVQNLNNRQIKRFGKIIIALVMRRHCHNCPGSVSGKNIIGNKYRNQLAVKRVLGLDSLKLHAGFAVIHRPLQIRLLGGFLNIGLNLSRIFKLPHQLRNIRMLRRQYHISYPESRIRTGCKHRQLFVFDRRAVGKRQAKIKLRAFRTSNPVNLLRLDSV